jgi:hypothetical protein
MRVSPRADPRGFRCARMLRSVGVFRRGRAEDIAKCVGQRGQHYVGRHSAQKEVVDRLSYQGDGPGKDSKPRQGSRRYWNGQNRDGYVDECCRQRSLGSAIHRISAPAGGECAFRQGGLTDGWRRRRGWTPGRGWSHDFSMPILRRTMDGQPGTMETTRQAPWGLTQPL